MITREADYAVRVILCLSARPSGAIVSTTLVAEEMELPYRFLRKIVRRLASAGLVGATRGKDGGIYLLHAPASISMYQVLEVFDPKALLFNSCYHAENYCSRQAHCSVHRQMKTVQDKINDQLRLVDFAALAQT